MNRGLKPLDYIQEPRIEPRLDPFFNPWCRLNEFKRAHYVEVTNRKINDQLKEKDEENAFYQEVYSGEEPIIWWFDIERKGRQ